MGLTGFPAGVLIADTAPAAFPTELCFSCLCLLFEAPFSFRAPNATPNTTFDKNPPPRHTPGRGLVHVGGRVAQPDAAALHQMQVVGTRDEPPQSQPPMISPQGSFRCQTSEVARSCQNTLPRSLTSRHTEQHVEPFRIVPPRLLYLCAPLVQDETVHMGSPRLQKPRPRRCPQQRLGFLFRADCLNI
jgi:hypothetical protein